MAGVQSLSAPQLKAMLDGKEDFELIDVRTEEEHALARIERGRLLDRDYAEELEAGPRERRLVFQCHHGVRSRAAALRFLAKGFTDVWNLEGGIEAYSDLDPSIPRY